MSGGAGPFHHIYRLHDKKEEFVVPSPICLKASVWKTMAVEKPSYDWKEPLNIELDQLCSTSLAVIILFAVETPEMCED